MNTTRTPSWPMPQTPPPWYVTPGAWSVLQREWAKCKPKPPSGEKP